LKEDKDLAVVVRLYRKSIEFFQSELLVDKLEIPKKFHERKSREDFYELLKMASNNKGCEDQTWSCAILRVMHVLNHLRNGLFRTFSEKIQEQVFGLFYGHIHKEEDGSFYLASNKKDRISLKDFEIKK